MANFRVYNIQLLPLDSRTTPEVGVKGYQKLFSRLNASVHKHIQEKRALEFSDTLSHETYIFPFFIHAEKEEFIAHGSFVRFHRAETVQDLYTNEALYTENPGNTAVSNIYLLRFVFDYEKHLLAIEELGGRLPSPLRFQKTLQHFFKPIANEYFDKYTLTVNLVSESKKLSQVLREAKGFSRIHVKLTFNNGSMLDDVLDELKENNVHFIEHTASAGSGAVMPKPTQYMYKLLNYSTKFGEASVTYFKQKKNGAKNALTKVVYQTKNFPKKFRMRQGVDESDLDFLRRAADKLKSYL